MGTFPIRSRVVVGAAVLLAGLCAGLPGAARAESGVGLAGRVLTATQPVPDATVYAYQVVEKTLRSVLTDGSGEFLFSDLPAGLYKIIAHKSGFAPVVTVLTRRTSTESQYVQVEMPKADGADGPEGYWQLRAEVPGDVLREIGVPLANEVISLVPAPQGGVRLPSLSTQVAATTGVSQLRNDTMAQVLTGAVGLRGRLGDVDLQLDGKFRTLDGNAKTVETSGFTAEAAALRVRVVAPAAGRFDLAAESNRLLSPADGEASPFDFERFQFRYRRDLGDDSSTALLAQYVDETGTYAGRRVHPLDLPLASRALRIEGTYARELGDRTSVRSGVRYRESLMDYPTRRGPATDGGILDRSFDAWSFADWRLGGAYVVQYGLFTTARDGSVSLAPRGGLVIRLRPDWQASLAATHRVPLSEDPTLRGEFVPGTLGASMACEDAEASCYELRLLHGEEAGDHVSVGGSWREFDRTVRLFLEDDFFASAEGVFLVPGDQLPELHANVSRQLGSALVTSWTTSYAQGGGGDFLAANRRFYQNDVTYLSTALDTTIRPTSTGIYIAFHRIEQRLDQLSRGLWRPATSADLERLEIAVSQNLDRLFDLNADWAVRVGLELLRGGTLFETLPVDPSQLRHRITTGVAVRF
jgi:hypothetical protein